MSLTTHPTPHALVVDDVADAASTMASLIAGHGYTVATTDSLLGARRRIELQQPDLVFLDLQLPDGNGLDLFKERRLLGGSQVVMMTGHGDVDTCIQAMRLGAMDYLLKPVEALHLKDLLSRAMRAPRLLKELVSKPLASAVRQDHGPQELLGRSLAMKVVRDQLARVAPTGVTVLVTGESGSGKELVAQMLHRQSARRHQSFVAVNCGAISPNLIESELFGHEKGSFTGAERQHAGYFEQASGGTLFLDEITEMPLELQVKLLRVLETGTFMRVGSTEARPTDVRVVAATNRDPMIAVAQGKLRDDLLYRLNVFPIHLPPLRERREDVAVLARQFLRDISVKEDAYKRFTPKALERLAGYEWPGNVRELRNVVHRAYVMALGDDVDDPCLPNDPSTWLEQALEEGEVRHLRVTLGTPWLDIQRQVAIATLDHFEGHHRKASKALGVSVKTLYNWRRTWSGKAPRFAVGDE